MIIWMCALHCEAKPIIDFYKLKKLRTEDAFDLYQCDQVACIVSGMGHKMKIATNWAIQKFDDPNHIWINIGIAGHLSLPLGSPVIANSVGHKDLPTQVELNALNIDGFISLPVISQTQENTDYRKDCVFDMEAYDFITTASTPINRCLCVKIISDNQQQPPTRNKAMISAWIAHHIPQLHKTIQHI